MSTSIMCDEATLVNVPMVRGSYKLEPNFADATELHTGYCSIQPFSMIEDEIDRDTTVSQCRLISDDQGFYQATAQHYIYWDDSYWKIDGRPHIWRYSNRVHHVEITMRLVVG